MEQVAALLLMMMVLAYTPTMVQCTTNSNSSFNIFLLAGQSNMVGFGGVNNSLIWDGVVPPECQPNPRILRLNNDLQWETAREPLHLGIGPPQPCGIGPGFPFANSTLKPGETIGLVPCAVGGTRIDQWLNGTAKYTHLLTRARAAVSNSGGTIRALLWYQGEQDANLQSRANLYKGRLVHFFNDLRTDLHLPSLPIIQVALATGRKYMEQVRHAQLNTGVPGVYTVDALKLNVTLQDDRFFLHLDTPSQLKLGKAMAALFLNISAPPN